MTDISLDAQQIAREFNYIREETGVSEEMALNILYNLWEKRKVELAPISEMLRWPVQN